MCCWWHNPNACTYTSAQENNGFAFLLAPDSSWQVSGVTLILVAPLYMVASTSLTCRVLARWCWSMFQYRPMHTRIAGPYHQIQRSLHTSLSLFFNSTFFLYLLTFLTMMTLSIWTVTSPNLPFTTANTHYFVSIKISVTGETVLSVDISFR